MRASTKARPNRVRFGPSGLGLTLILASSSFYDSRQQRTFLSRLDKISKIIHKCFKTSYQLIGSSKKTGKKVFFSSSSEVYGEPVELPQHEYSTPLNSRVPYAVVKNVGECFFKSYQQTYGLPYTIFRFFNTYGPNQSTDFVVARFLSAALRNEPITLYGDGSQTRTFTYVDDTVDTCIKIFEDGLLDNDVINVGNDRVVQIKELAELVIDVTKSKSPLVFLPPLKDPCS